MEFIENKKYRIYVTKYVLTRGIFVVTAEYVGGGMMRYARSNCLAQYFHGQNKAWCMTQREAVECAKKIIEKKIISLENSIKKYRRALAIKGGICDTSSLTPIPITHGAPDFNA